MTDTPIDLTKQDAIPTTTMRTNTLAIISLVASVLSFLFLPVVGAITGVITGHIALRQISATEEQGRALALWGVILGYLHLLFAVGAAALLVVLIFVFGVAFIPHLFAGTN